MSRRRIRASDIAAPNPRKGLLALGLIGIALTLILLFKGSFGDSTAGFMDHLTRDPDLDLPETALERGTISAPASASEQGTASVPASASEQGTASAPASAQANLAPVAPEAVEGAPATRQAAPASQAPAEAATP